MARFPVYLRIFDPDMGNKHDEFVGAPNTSTRFSVYGGKGAFSSKEARETGAIGVTETHLGSGLAAGG